MVTNLEEKRTWRRKRREFFETEDGLSNGRMFASAVAVMVSIAVSIILILVFATVAHAADYTDEQAVMAIIGEAENQGALGMEAVACGIRNRGTLSGVYGLKAKRVTEKLYSEKIYYLAKSAWVVSENKDRCDKLIHGADHWENVEAFGLPCWAKSCIETFRHRDHVFFKIVKRKNRLVKY